MGVGEVVYEVDPDAEDSDEDVGHRKIEQVAVDGGTETSETRKMFLDFQNNTGSTPVNDTESSTVTSTQAPVHECVFMQVSSFWGLVA